MSLSAASFKRLGLCIIAIFILVVYATASATIRLNFYFPIHVIGLFIFAAYSWFVATKCKSIYPKPAKAVGQLSLTFLVVGLSTSNQFEKFKKSIPTSDSNVDDLIYTAAIYNAEITICSAMTIGLFISYLILKRKQRKATSN